MTLGTVPFRRLFGGLAVIVGSTALGFFLFDYIFINFLSKDASPIVSWLPQWMRSVESVGGTLVVLGFGWGMLFLPRNKGSAQEIPPTTKLDAEAIRSVVEKLLARQIDTAFKTKADPGQILMLHGDLRLLTEQLQMAAKRFCGRADKVLSTRPYLNALEDLQNGDPQAATELLRAELCQRRQSALTQFASPELISITHAYAALCYFQQPEQARHCYQFILEQNDEDMVAWNQLLLLDARIGEWEEVQERFESIERLRLGAHRRHYFLIAASNMALLYHAAEESRCALALIERARHLSKMCNDRVSLARLEANAAMILAETGNVAAAKHAVARRRALHVDSEICARSKAAALEICALVAKCDNDAAQAIDLLQKASTHYQLMNCYTAQARMQTQLADLLHHQGKYEASFDLLWQALHTFQDFRGWPEQVHILRALAHYFFIADDYERAERALQQGLELAMALSMEKDLAMDYANLAMVLSAKQENRRAIRYHLKSFAAYEEQENFEGVTRQHIALACSFAQENNKTRAYRHAQEARYMIHLINKANTFRDEIQWLNGEFPPALPPYLRIDSCGQQSQILLQGLPCLAAPAGDMRQRAATNDNE